MSVFMCVCVCTGGDCTFRSDSETKASLSAHSAEKERAREREGDQSLVARGKGLDSYHVRQVFAVYFLLLKTYPYLSFIFNQSTAQTAFSLLRQIPPFSLC